MEIIKKKARKVRLQMTQEEWRAKVKRVREAESGVEKNKIS